MNNKNILDSEIATMSTYSFFETSFSGSGNGKTLEITCHVRKTEMNPTTDWMADAFSIVETGKNQVSLDSEWLIERDAPFDEVRVKMERAFRETVNEYSSDVLLLDSARVVAKHPSFLRIEQFHDVMIVKTLENLRLVSNGAKSIRKEGKELNMGIENFKKASAWVRLMKDMTENPNPIFSTAKITDDEQKRLEVFGEAYEKKQKEREAEKERLEEEGRKGVIDFLLKEPETIENLRKQVVLRFENILRSPSLKPFNEFSRTEALIAQVSDVQEIIHYFGSKSSIMFVDNIEDCKPPVPHSSWINPWVNIKLKRDNDILPTHQCIILHYGVPTTQIYKKRLERSKTIPFVDTSIVLVKDKKQCEHLIKEFNMKDYLTIKRSPQFSYDSFKVVNFDTSELEEGCNKIIERISPLHTFLLEKMLHLRSTIIISLIHRGNLSGRFLRNFREIVKKSGSMKDSELYNSLEYFHDDLIDG